MKKRFFVIIALSLAAAVSSAPVLSHAVEVETIPLQNGGMVVFAQSSEDACQTVEEILRNLQEKLEFCPETEIPEEPETSETEAPEESDIPEAEFPEQPETPETELPEQPGTPETELPEQPGTPETELPERPETPETEIPGQPETEFPEQPDTSEPELPEWPDTELPEQPANPDTGSSETPDTETADPAQAYIERVVHLVNEEREKAGLSGLTMDSDLIQAANVRAKEIRQSFSHTRPNGSSFSSVLNEQGISYRGSGENIAWGQKSPEEVVVGWMNSEGHRANILNKNFEKIGVGYYQDERGVNYWVQLFTY